jgi:hypothetical protein
MSSVLRTPYGTQLPTLAGQAHRTVPMAYCALPLITLLSPSAPLNSFFFLQYRQFSLQTFPSSHTLTFYTSLLVTLHVLQEPGLSLARSLPSPTSCSIIHSSSLTLSTLSSKPLPLPTLIDPSSELLANSSCQFHRPSARSLRTENHYQVHTFKPPLNQSR